MSGPRDEFGEGPALSRGRALARTGLAFVTVALAWLALASFLPNFHVADSSWAARATFVGIVMSLLALILVAQLAMLRTWFRSLGKQRPERAPQIARLRTLIVALVLAGVVLGLGMLWYATVVWMPQVQQAVRGAKGPER